MGRGDNGELTQAVARRNPFRQDIVDRGEAEREAEEKRRIEEKERAEQRAEALKARKDAADKAELERIEAMEEARKERRAEFSDEVRERIEKREAFLQKSGITVFDPESPGEQYSENEVTLLPEDYPRKIEKLDDPLLQEDGKNFAFSVSDGREQEKKGFAKSKEEAQEVIDSWIKDNVAKKIEKIKAEEAQFLQKERYNRQKRAKQEIIGGLPLDRWDFVDAYGRVNCGERLFDEKTTDIQREEISGFEIVTYKFEGAVQVVAFRDGVLALQTSGGERLTPIIQTFDSYYGRSYKTGDPIATLAKRKSEDQLMKEAYEIAVEKHGPAPFAGGLPGITRGRREKKERQNLAREETRKRALDELRQGEDERVRQEILSQVKTFIKGVLSEEALENI